MRPASCRKTGRFFCASKKGKKNEFGDVLRDAPSGACTTGDAPSGMSAGDRAAADHDLYLF